MHQDRLKTKPPTKAYDKGWDRIWEPRSVGARKPQSLPQWRSIVQASAVSNRFGGRLPTIS